MADLPPDDERCTATYREKYKKDPSKVGQRCERPADGDDGLCRHHRPLADDKRCKAPLSPNHPTDPGGRCPNRSMNYQPVCGQHGGHAPQSLAGAQRREAEAKLERQVERTLARLEVAPVDNPLTALAQLAGQVVAWQDALADKVNALTDIRYEDARGAEQLRSEVALYERAMDRCNTVLGQIAKLDIDTRLAAISERQAEAIIGVIEGLLDFLGVTGPQATAAKQFAARKLRAVK